MQDALLRAWRYEQREAVELAFVATGCGHWRHLPTNANGQAEVGSYLWNDDARAHLGWSVDVLTLRGRGSLRSPRSSVPTTSRSAGCPLRCRDLGEPS
ncbi:hypothetical protein [Pseudonocardia sp.]|jgi:hypothetical protein|uniref:hypothetical protein n=1 Tax=Pseudonocardia sp. TaxID=60912 RepID=UPI0031FD1DFB